MMNNTYSPIRETAQEGTESYFHEEPSSIWCACFRFPCFPSTQKEGEANSLLQERENRDSWIVKNMKELKEYSELVAGPKWKNLVRKMGKYCNPKKSSAKTTQFQYDSDSYALNFDNGGGDVREDDDGLLRNFSSRFAAPFSGFVANNSNNPNKNAGL
ncbi:hypothetical protein RDI58_017198 [Solanum bulbocastanum]|uniref:Stress induced protein n=1 Tax=Solanum bulbocastanum TaxID=147425 RepID=A0AAN8Y8Q3_SOLBU